MGLGSPRDMTQRDMPNRSRALVNTHARTGTGQLGSTQCASLSPHPWFGEVSGIS